MMPSPTATTRSAIPKRLKMRGPPPARQASRRARAIPRRRRANHHVANPRGQSPQRRHLTGGHQHQEDDPNQAPQIEQDQVPLVRQKPAQRSGTRAGRHPRMRSASMSAIPAGGARVQLRRLEEPASGRAPSRRSPTRPAPRPVATAIRDSPAEVRPCQTTRTIADTTAATDPSTSAESRCVGNVSPPGARSAGR